MAYKVKFANQNLDDYCKILTVSRDILPERENYSKDIPTMNGSYFTGFKYKERKIVLEVAIAATSKIDYMQKVRKLADVLNVESPSRLIIDDEPDIYYYAVVDGGTDLSRKFNTGTINITFVCHDPVAYSNNWSSFQPNASRIVTLDNVGTTDTNMVVDVDFRGDACFFQITNHKGETVLVGRPKDATKPSVPLTDTVVNDPCELSSSFTPLAQSLLDMDRVADGAFGVGNSGNGIVCTNYGSEVENKWTGTSFRRNLGADVTEFEVAVDVTFTSTGKNYANPTPPSGGGGSTGAPLGSWKVVNCGGLWINRDANMNNPIYAMAPNTIIYPTEFSGNWAKHTHTAKYGTYTGWSHKRYLQKISDGKVTKSDEATINEDETNYAEYQCGIIEVYGYDKNGQKLFKIELKDSNEFYEYVEPSVRIGSTVVLDDGKNAPSPRTVEVKDNEGKVTETKKVASGVFGDYNDFDGKIIVRREKNSSGQYLWSATVEKVKNGVIVRSMSTSNSLVSNSYPKGALNYIGCYIGKYGKNNPVDLVSLNNIKVRRLNFNNDAVITDNSVIFEDGEHLQINFDKGTVTLDNKPIETELDIGSEFFSTPVGKSEIIYNTDDKNAVVVCGIQHRYL